MEKEEYVRIFLENNPSWKQCPACEGLHKKSNFKHCAYCDLYVCMNCHRSHEIHPGSCMILELGE